MTTRVNLRRALGVRTGQPFFRRFGPVEGTATGGTGTTLVDTAWLLQPDDFWNGNWLYLPATDTVRLITDFAQATWTITFLETVAPAIGAGTKYEVWSSFSPYEIHGAMNDSLRDAWPNFFDYNEAYVVLQKDVGVSYSLAAISPTIKHLFQLWVEVGASSVTGAVTNVVAQNQLRDTARVFTVADIGKTIRIYHATGLCQGDYRTISAVPAADTVQVSANFSSILQVGDNYRMTDERTASLQYCPILAWGVNRYNNPTILRLSAHPGGYEGNLMRLVYESEYAPYTAETTDNTCPQEYLELASLARLFLSKFGSLPETSLKSWVAQQQSYAAAAQAYAEKNKFQHMASQLTDDSVRFSYPTDYPF